MAMATCEVSEGGAMFFFGSYTLFVFVCEDCIESSERVLVVNSCVCVCDW